MNLRRERGQPVSPTGNRQASDDLWRCGLPISKVARRRRAPAILALAQARKVFVKMSLQEFQVQVGVFVQCLENAFLETPSF
jgi:hypothetical protein